jgi:single-stranded-DNA-specific exonuclease
LIERYLDPSLDELSDPALLPDLAVAATRLDHALTAREPVFLFGDYDVDGMTSIALLRRYLSRLGGRLRTRIPDRLTEGYGLSEMVVGEAHAWGARLLVTADCGTTAHAPIARARELGLDVIVADHHQPEGSLPPATAIVNPWREESRVAFPDLAAVGVATRIIEGLWRLRTDRGQETPSPFDLLDLTAIGTIADSVRLEGDNRVLVHHGLRILRENPRPAMRALMRICGIARDHVGSGDIAFRIAPRLNAAGRLGDAPTALELLLSEDGERCEELAAILDRHNRERQILLERVVLEATRQAEADGAPARGEPIVLASGDWHLGVLGIGAARLAERFGVPAILLAQEGTTLRGSGRTAGDCDLLGLLRACSGLLASFGGHRAAVGLRLDAADFVRLRARLGEEARGLGVPLGPKERIQWIDAHAEMDEVDLPLVDWIDRLGPFGQGNQEPVFALRGRVEGPVRILKERHLRFDLTAPGVRRECIGFGMAEQAGTLSDREAEVHVAATPTRNVYRGEARIQLQLRDIAREDPFGQR